MKEEALKLADELDLIAGMLAIGDRIKWGQDSELMENGSAMIRRLVEELDKKQQGLVEASAMLFNYKYELDLERAMSAQLKEEVEKQK